MPPVLYIKHKQEEKCMATIPTCYKGKRERKQRKRAGKRYAEPGLKEDISQRTE